MSEILDRLFSAACNVAPLFKDGVYCSCDTSGNNVGSDHTARCLQLDKAIKEVKASPLPRKEGRITNKGGHNDGPTTLKPDVVPPSQIARKEVISVQPGDVIVLKTERLLTVQQHAEMKAEMLDLFPDSKGVILAGDMTMEVYREQKCGPLDVTNISGKKEYVCGNCPTCSVGRDINKCPKIHREQEANPYAKHKNTCTDCDKGPCDRTLHNPCGQGYRCTYMNKPCPGSCSINPNSARCSHREKIEQVTSE